MIQWTSHKGRVLALGYSPDGAMLVSGGHDHQLRVWDPVSGEQRANFRDRFQPIEDLAFSPDGRLLALATGQPGAVVCDQDRLRNGSIYILMTTCNFDVGVSSVAFSPDGRNLVIAGILRGSRTRAMLWDVTDLRTGRQRGERSPRVVLGIRDNDWLIAAYALDGRTIALGGSRGLIKLWPDPVSLESLRWQHEGFERVAQDRDVRRSRVVEVRAGGEDPVRRIAFSPDGTTLAAAIGNVVDLWDYRHPDEERPLVSNRRQLRGHTGAVQSLAFAPDGRTIATASLDGTLRIWDARETFELACLDAGAGPLHCLAFSPDGMTVAVGGERGDVIIFDMDERL